MKAKAGTRQVDKKKVVSITLLFVFASAIVVSGLFFAVLSFIENIQFNVLNGKVHGAVFGIVVAFLGVRYLLSVKKLKEKVFAFGSKFSCSNFKKK
jgi:hypothetical protein